jgi:hypothetical protein
LAKRPRAVGGNVDNIGSKALTRLPGPDALEFVQEEETGV